MKGISSWFFFQTISAQRFAVGAHKNNMLYIGVENPLSTTIENYP